MATLKGHQFCGLVPQKRSAILQQKHLAVPAGGKKRLQRTRLCTQCSASVIEPDLIEGIARTGTVFADCLSRILKPQSVNSTLEKLPVFFQKDGERLQYGWDGKTLRIVPVEEKKEELIHGPERHGQVPKHVQAVVDRIKRAVYRTFVPEHVRTHYLAYMRWKFLHRTASSIIQVQGTQAMLQAIGIGARRALPAAAGLNWVLKDGLGRLGRFVFSGSLGSTFDSNLKKVRFSTSVLFTLSLGLEMLTAIFPNYFLLFATMANIGKSIALAAYLATSAAIHKSFAVGDNLADIAAKGQVQTVVADNLGLAVAVALDSLARSNKMVRQLLLLAIFPTLAALDLYAIYNELQSVHLQTLNKARLQIIVEGWLHTGQVPSSENVSKVECRQIVQITGRRTLPLRIGALNPRGWKREDLMRAFQCQTGQSFAIFEEMQGFSPFPSQIPQRGLLLWLHDGFTAKDVITALLQVELMRSILYSKCEPSSSESCLEDSKYKPPIDDISVQELKSKYGRLDLKRSSRGWASFVVESREQAEAFADHLIEAMEATGWQTQNILLDPQERQTYSTKY
ncbi:unnamed protein product [Calypogeia fissa]